MATSKDDLELLSSGRAPSIDKVSVMSVVERLAPFDSGTPRDFELDLLLNNFLKLPPSFFFKVLRPNDASEVLGSKRKNF